MSLLFWAPNWTGFGVELAMNVGWLFNAHLWGGLFIVASGERDE